MRERFICAVVLFLGFSLQHLLADPIVSQDRRKFADGLYARKMYELAAREYSSLLETEPKAEEAGLWWFRVGESYRELGEHIKAERAYVRASTLAADPVLREKAVYKRAAMFLQLGFSEASVELFSELLKRNPPPELRAAALLSLSDALCKEGQSLKAIEMLETLLKEFPGSENVIYARLQLGRLYVELGEKEGHDRALQELAFVIKEATSQREKAEARFLMAHLYYLKGEFSKSAREFVALQTDYPDDIRASSSRREAAWALYHSGGYDEVIDLSSKGLASPDAERRDEWLYLRANSFRGKSRNKEAVEDYVTLLNVFAESRFANASRLELALVYYTLGNYKDVVAVASGLDVDDAKRPHLLWLLAESYSALSREDDAMKYYRLLAKEFPDGERVADALYRVAYMLQQKELWAEAAQQYRDIEKRFPKHKLAARSLFSAGVCYIRCDQGPDAVSTWRMLADKYPDYSDMAEVRYQLSLELIRQENHDVALKELDKFLMQYPNHVRIADAYYWKGSLLCDQEMSKQAEAALRAALERSEDRQLDTDIRFRLGIVLLQLKRDAEAVALFSSLMEPDAAQRFTPERIFWLAEFQYDNDNFEGCIKAARMLVTIHKQPNWQEIGWTLIGRGNQSLKLNDNAIAAFKKAVVVNAGSSFSAESALRLGQLLSDKPNHEEAMKWLSEASKRASGKGMHTIRAEAYLAMGSVSEGQGDDDAALRFFMTVSLLFDDEDRVPEAYERAIVLLGRLRRLDERSALIAELHKRFPKSAAAGRYSDNRGVN